MMLPSNMLNVSHFFSNRIFRALKAMRIQIHKHIIIICQGICHSNRFPNLLLWETDGKTMR